MIHRLFSGFIRVGSTVVSGSKMICSNYVRYLSSIMERQRHGFKYEDSIIEREGLIKSRGYTDEKDALLIAGNNKIPVQIKFQGIANEICLASYNRNRSATNNFILHLGFYKGIKTNIIEERTYYVLAQLWNKHCSYSEHDNMLTELKLITKLKEDDKRWEEFRTKHQALWDSFPNRFIRFRAKRDSKGQRRIQLAIPVADRSSLDLLFLRTSFADIRKQFDSETNKIVNTADKSSQDVLL